MFDGIVWIVHVATAVMAVIELALTAYGELYHYTSP